MVYAVDFVLEVMKKISSSEPVLFQRDGSLYIASTEGFGQVSYGLPIRPEQIQAWEKRTQHPAILESIEAIKWIGEEPPIRSFIPGEKQYLKAISFGPDSNEFNLENIAKTAQKLATLIDDEKIRMISHGSEYHSHKYGYACDGTDVFVSEARVMNRKRYLELIKEEENRLIRAMDWIGKVEERRDIDYEYKKLKMPDCMILTPYLMVSLPRDGDLNLHRDGPDSWTEKTMMHSNYDNSMNGSILRHRRISTNEESPFRITLTLNTKQLHGVNEGDLKSSKEKLLNTINGQLSAVISSMPLAQEFLEKLNGIHNKVCAREIEWWKELRRENQANTPQQLPLNLG